jgi:uncharacterized protein
MPELLVACALIAYNAFFNRWPPFHGRAYVPVNVAAGFVLVGVAVNGLGLSLDRIGFSGGLAPAAPGFAAGVLLAAPLFFLARSRSRAHLVADARATPDDVVFRTLVRIPIGTALFEEVVFRGVLLGALLDEGRTIAIVGSAGAFGLWHIEPARLMARMNGRPVAPTIVATVALTFVAGIALAVLRIASGGLALPVALHASVNALANLASRQALRSTF